MQTSFSSEGSGDSEQQRQEEQQPQKQREPSVSKSLLSRYTSISNSRNGGRSSSMHRSNHLEKMLEHRENKMKSDTFHQINNESSRTVTTQGILESSYSNLSLSFNPHDDSCGADESNNGKSHLREQDHNKEYDRVEDLIVEVETKEKVSNSKTEHLCCDSMPGGIGKIREACGRIVKNEHVQLVIILMIVINAVMMGIGTFDFVTDDPDVNAAWEKTDQAFLIVFTVELALQLVYHGPRLFADAWLVFDFFIVVLSWSMESLQVIRAFRVFRAFRLVTRMTVLKNLIEALFAVAPSIGVIMALLLLILYIYGVVCTVLFKDLYRDCVTDEDYFGRLDKSLFSLFQIMSLSWSHIVRQVMKEYYWAWGIFSSFLVFSSFILYSLVIAVLCDAVSETEHHDKKANVLDEQTETRLRLRDLQAQVDKMAVHQAAAMAAIQYALEGLEDVGVAEPPDDSMLEQNDNRRQRHVTYNLDPSHPSSIQYLMSLSDDEEGSDGEPVLVFETDSDLESSQQINDSDAAAAEAAPLESQDIHPQDEQHRPTDDAGNS
jgi:hypothetical protein